MFDDIYEKNKKKKEMDERVEREEMCSNSSFCRDIFLEAVISICKLSRPRQIDIVASAINIVSEQFRQFERRLQHSLEETSRRHWKL